MKSNKGKVGCMKCGYIKKDCVCKKGDFHIRDTIFWMENIGETW